MGFSYEQAKSWGIGHLHPAANGKSVNERIRELVGMEPPPPSQRYQPPNDAMNKTERAFSKSLPIGWWLNHSLKVRLAGRTWYTPDFFVVAERPTFIEIKGFMRDDAAVKIKVAAELYPQFCWLLVRREGRNGWDVREVTNRGIGTSPIVVPWIAGG